MPYLIATDARGGVTSAIWDRVDRRGFEGLLYNATHPAAQYALTARTVGPLVLPPIYRVSRVRRLSSLLPMGLRLPIIFHVVEEMGSLDG
jgi:hypothetical protein